MRTSITHSFHILPPIDAITDSGSLEGDSQSFEIFEES